MFEKLAKIPSFGSKLVFWLLKSVSLSSRIVSLTFYIFKSRKNLIFGRFRESRDGTRDLLFFSGKNRPNGPFDRMAWPIGRVTRPSDRSVMPSDRMVPAWEFWISIWPLANRPIGMAIRPIHLVDRPIDITIRPNSYPAQCYPNRPSGRMIIPSDRLIFPFDRSATSFDRLIWFPRSTERANHPVDSPLHSTEWGPNRPEVCFWPYSCGIRS